MSSLIKRCLSAAVLIPVVLGIVYLGGYFYIAFLGIIGAIATNEWRRITDPDLPFTFRGWFMLTNLSPLLLIHFLPVIVTVLWIGLTLAVTGIVVSIFHKDRPLKQTSGIPLIGGNLVFLYDLRLSPELLDVGHPSWSLMLMLFLMIWGTDTLAYFTGRSIGGPKLAPEISPNKTWSGFVGAMAGAGLGAYFYHFILTIDPQLLWICLITGPLLGAAAQMGDLYISAQKRRVGVKDTGSLIPGHGGILDRIDGLLFMAPLFWAMLQILDLIY
jgi:phosphatidate cytidylyltransferase